MRILKKIFTRKKRGFVGVLEYRNGRLTEVKK
jgi:hypothetical protein